VCRTQLLNFKVRMKAATPAEAAEVTAVRRADGNKLKPAWDSQGFRKLLVLLTAVGKLLALHNGDGRVVWSNFLSAGGALPPHALFMARTPPEDDVAPELLAVQTVQGVGGAATRLTTLDAWTGATLAAKELPFVASRILQTSMVRVSEKGVRDGGGDEPTPFNRRGREMHPRESRCRERQRWS
jgi:hypothetical protein